MKIAGQARSPQDEEGGHRDTSGRPDRRRARLKKGKAETGFAGKKIDEGENAHRHPSWKNDAKTSDDRHSRNSPFLCVK